MSMTMRERLVRGYAFSIYLDGTRTFDMIAEQYHEEVKTYAANYLSEQNLNDALATGKITQTEYEQTLELKNPA